MKLNRLVSICAVVFFGASTAIYAANVTETDKLEEKNAVESFEQESKDNMAEHKQLPETELHVQDEVKPEEVQEEKKEETEESTKQQKDNETISVAGAVDNTTNIPRETETENFDPKSLIPPGNEEEWESKFRKYALFYYDNAGAKQIVTKVKADGTFCAEDLGIWLKKQDVYDISVLEEDGNCKKLLYKSNPENQQKEEFEPTDDTEYLYFNMLVVPEEYIIYEGGYIEIVDEVYSDGSFTTNYMSE